MVRDTGVKKAKGAAGSGGGGGAETLTKK